MPFSNMLKEKYTTMVKCGEKPAEEKDELGKEKTKEFIHDHQVLSLPSAALTLSYAPSIAAYSDLLISAETPPPDFI